MSNALLTATNPSNENFTTLKASKQIMSMQTNNQLYDSNATDMDNFNKFNMPESQAYDSPDEDARFNSEEEADDNIISPPEPTPFMRSFYRFLMGIIPAICANFLTQDVIGVISKAAGFLAPPFVIIFPALLTIRLRDEGKIQLNNGLYYALWTF